MAASTSCCRAAAACCGNCDAALATARLSLASWSRPAWFALAEAAAVVSCSVAVRAAPRARASSRASGVTVTVAVSW